MSPINYNIPKGVAIKLIKNPTYIVIALNKEETLFFKEVKFVIEVSTTNDIENAYKFCMFGPPGWIGHHKELLTLYPEAHYIKVESITEFKISPWTGL